MVTKAIIEEIISDYSVRVRIPMFDGMPNDTNYVQKENLSIAYFSLPSNYKYRPLIGDIVFVSFEDDMHDKPIIVGTLYRDYESEVTSQIDLSSINVKDNCNLPYDTKIGEITPSNIQHLKGSTDNIQLQLDRLKEGVDGIESEIIIIPFTLDESYHFGDLTEPFYKCDYTRKEIADMVAKGKVVFGKVGGKYYTTYLGNSISMSNIRQVSSDKITIETLYMISPTNNHAVLYKTSIDCSSNKNLLDNPFFTINQRGKSEYLQGSAEYTVDRWKKSASVDVKCEDNYGVELKFNETSTSAFAHGFWQIVDISKYAGKTLTFSIDFGSVNAGVNARLRFVDADNQFIISNAFASLTTGINSFTTTVPENANTVWCQVGNRTNIPIGAVVVVNSMKLELGDTSTLAVDEPPEYEIELAKCQRYYQRLKNVAFTYTYNYAQAVNGSANSYLSNSINFKEMVSTPIVKFIPDSSSNIGVVFPSTYIPSNSLGTYFNGDNVTNTSYFTLGTSSVRGRVAQIYDIEFSAEP